MAIQPVDLQTIYSQLDKVSRQAAQTAQAEQAARDVRQEAAAREALRRRETVDEAASESGVDAVNARGRGRGGSGGRGKHRRAPAPAPAGGPPAPPVVLSESYLGQLIDISG